MQSLICLCNIVKFEELFRSIITCIAIRCIRWNDKEREKKGGTILFADNRVARTISFRTARRVASLQPASDSFLLQ